MLFGRLKTLWDLFTELRTIEEQFFDRFFDIACALTNIDILNRPLPDEDLEFNEGVHNSIVEDLAIKLRKKKWANEEYNRRRRERLQYDSADSVTEEYEYPQDN